FRRVTFPLILPAVVSALLVAFTTSFDEYAVASFLAGSRPTFPLFLYSALRFPSQLPQVIAVAVVVITLTVVVIVAAEVWRRRVARRGARPGALRIAKRKLVARPGLAGRRLARRASDPPGARRDRARAAGDADLEGLPRALAQLRRARTCRRRRRGGGRCGR